MIASVIVRRLNMLSESNNIVYLQKYIIKSIVQFFSNPSEVFTSRYVLYFDSEENIIDFDIELRKFIMNDLEVNHLKAQLGNSNLKIDLLDNYEFYNDEGSVEYEATQLRIANEEGERILVFVPDYDREGLPLGDAFKNNIRNLFIDKAEDKILFYLSMQNIASVSKTTENFQRQGMPLSINSVYDYLYSQVHIVQGINQQKVLFYSLDKIKSNKPQNDNSLLEFAPIMRIIASQQLLSDDFHDLHMFPMALTDLGKKDSNLAENYRLFRTISLALNDQELESVMTAFDYKIVNELQKSYEKDEENWDKKFTYEGILKHKKINTKKFKLEQPIVLLDKNDVMISKEHYLDFQKTNSSQFIIFTKDLPEDEKEFKIVIRFTQKASVTDDSNFVVEQINTRGNAFRIILNRHENFYNGKVVFVGGKKSEFTVGVSVMDAPASFLSNSCYGLKIDKNGSFTYLLEAKDYTLTLGDGENFNSYDVELHKPSAISWPVISSNRTKFNFEKDDDEVKNDFLLKMDLDNQDIQIVSKVKFSEEKARILELYELFNKSYVERNVYSIDDEIIYNKNKKSERFETSGFNVSGNKYQLKDLLTLESEIINNSILYAQTNGLKNIKSVDLKIPSEIRDAIDDICKCFCSYNSIPSLCYINDEIISKYKEYIKLVLKYVGEGSSWFVDKQNISTETLNIFKIGMICDSDNLIWISPLNPLSVAYQLELANEKISLVELDSYLYSSLGFGNSLPFIETDDGLVFQSIKGDYPLSWACYCDSSKSIKGEESTYANKINYHPLS